MQRNKLLRIIKTAARTVQVLLVIFLVNIFPFRSLAAAETPNALVRCAAPLTADDCANLTQQAFLPGEYSQRFQLLEIKGVTENNFQGQCREEIRGRIEVTFQESNPASRRQLFSLLFLKKSNGEKEVVGKEDDRKDLELKDAESKNSATKEIQWVRDQKFLWGETLVFDLSVEVVEPLVDFVETETTLLNEYSVAEIRAVPETLRDASNNTTEFDLLLVPDDVGNKKLSNKHVRVFKRDEEFSLE